MEFHLFAPHNERVDLIGSWAADQPVAMTRGDDGFWRTDVELPDGRYTFRYRLPSLSSFMPGEVVEIGDPWARMVDDWQGEASVVVVDGGRDVTTAPDFVWEHDDVELVSNEGLIIYELHVGEFGSQGDEMGTFLTVIERLDYLRDLGINAVEIMPVMAFPGDRGWGYNIRYPFAPEPTYGTPAEFKQLVDACHARGLRVILDIVLNHSQTEAPLTRIDYDYFYRKERKGELSFGAPFDYDRRDDELDVMPARMFALDQIAFWVREYQIDGYRLDAVAMMENPGFVAEVRVHAHDTVLGKPFYVVAEQIPEDPDIAGPDGPADGAWHQTFQRAVVALACGDIDADRIAAALDPAPEGYATPELVVNYIESHDEETLMRELSGRGISGQAAFRRDKLAVSILFTAVGIPMLYQGGEFGGYRKRSQEVGSIQWDLLDDDYGLDLKEHYAFLARTRRDQPALTGSGIDVIHVGEGEIVYRRGAGDGAVIVVANLVDQDRHLSVPFPDGAWWFLTGERPWDISGGRMDADFAASEVRLLVGRGRDNGQASEL